MVNHVLLNMIYSKGDGEVRNLGYRCGFCGMQQRQPLSDRFTKKGTIYRNYVDEFTNKVIDNIELCASNSRAGCLSLRQDKEQVAEILKFLMNIERYYKKDTLMVWANYPIILK